MPTAPQANFQDPDHKKWYQKTGWIIALLILFFPVGLFLMWKYTNWKKPIKGIITALILIIALSGIVSPDKLEQITLKADTEQTYDINQKISIEATTTPSDYELSSSDFKCSGGKITTNNQNISFIATKDGSYKIWAEHDGIKSNKLTVKVEDKAAIAKQRAKEEQKRLAEEKAQKEAEEKAAQEKAAQEAAKAQAKAEAEAQAAAQAQAQAEAQQQAQAATQAQQNNDPTVYITNTGGKYHRAGCRFLKQSQIEKHLSEVKGVYGPCGVCNPPQ
nr:MAG TPA: DNA methyl phosphotriester repair domain protein [Caudoviricetes sp.]